MEINILFSEAKQVVTAIKVDNVKIISFNKESDIRYQCTLIVLVMTNNQLLSGILWIIGEQIAGAFTG